MIDELPIPGEWIGQGGAVALLGLVVVMILTGRLVPRTFYNSLEKERDYWREAARTSMGSTQALLPAARIASEVTRALAGATGVHDDEPKDAAP